MPSGKVHRGLIKSFSIIALILSSMIGYTAYMFLDGWWKVIGVFVFLGYLLEFYIDPDLDQANTTSGEWKLMRDFKLLGAWLVGWFVPYGYAFTHRSFISHFPFVSTLPRFIWLLAFPPNALILWYNRLEVISTYHPILVGLYVGLSLGDTVHYLADVGIIKG